MKRIAKIMKLTENAVRLKYSRIKHVHTVAKKFKPDLKTLIQQVNTMVADLPNAEMRIQDNQLKVFILEYKEI